jgi:hypothetical protein
MVAKAENLEMGGRREKRESRGRRRRRFVAPRKIIRTPGWESTNSVWLDQT